jgi:hypothetical protein
VLAFGCCCWHALLTFIAIPREFADEVTQLRYVDQVVLGECVAITGDWSHVLLSVQRGGGSPRHILLSRCRGGAWISASMET